MFTIDDCRVVDLFCGVGGLTHGFVLEGFQVVAGIDADPSCKYAYETNNSGSKFVLSDIRELDSDGISEWFEEGTIKILVGCAPCQPFSQYSIRAGKSNDDWQLVEKFAELIESTLPDIVSMENVPLLKKHPVFTQFVNKLQELDYKVSWDVVYAPDYGIPQERERLVLLASKRGDIKLIEKTHTPERYVTVRDTIEDMERLEAGDISPNDPIHKVSGLSKKNIKRIKASKPGGTWRDWDESLRLACHKKDTGSSYVSVYGRMSWDKPSPTMTTQFYGYGNGRFGHPEQNRAISLREGALLQTFPETYQFAPPNTKVNTSTLGKHIGNAVPVKLGQVIAKSIIKHLE